MTLRLTRPREPDGRVYADGSAADADELRAWFAKGGRVMVLNADGTEHGLAGGSAELIEIFNRELCEKRPQTLGLRLVR